MPQRRNPSDDPLASELEPVVDSALNAFGRLDRSRQIALLVLVLIGLIALLFYYEHVHTPANVRNGAASAPIASIHALLGNPSGASADPSFRDNYLMVKPYYVLSYNDSAGTPNWVSWQVTESDLGSAPRKQVFDSDNALPAGFKVVTHKDYAGGGFDRGHMCPHSDRGANEEMSYATFVMTNIIPQAPNVNQKAWAQLENYNRALVRRGHHLYTISGPLGTGGRGRNGFAQSLAGGKVNVPAECWKIVVVVDEGGGDDDLVKLSAATRVIAVIMPNDQEVVGEEWAGYRTSVAEIERRTGFRFFDQVRPDVAESLRQQVDSESIPPPRPMGHGRD